MDVRQKKQSLLNALYEPYKRCMQCPLATQGRKTIVFGEGNPDAQIMFVGEGPGREEDLTGRPFIGRSGKLLTKALESQNLKREDVFITSVVKCRPPDNRKPTPLESGTCKNILLYKQVEIIDPYVICTLGATAFAGFMNQELSIGNIRGKTFLCNNAIIVPTYHPAYILRNPSALQFLVEDIKKSMSIAQELAEKK